MKVNKLEIIIPNNRCDECSFNFGHVSPLSNPNIVRIKQYGYYVYRFDQLEDFIAYKTPCVRWVIHYYDLLNINPSVIIGNYQTVVGKEESIIFKRVLIEAIRSKKIDIIHAN